MLYYTRFCPYKWKCQVMWINQMQLTHLKRNKTTFGYLFIYLIKKGVQWLSGRVLDSRPRGRGFEPHQHHCYVSLSKNINPSLVLVQPRKTRPFVTERLLMGRKESNQTNKQNLIKMQLVFIEFRKLAKCRICNIGLKNLVYFLKSITICKNIKLCQCITCNL